MDGLVSMNMPIRRALDEPLRTLTDIESAKVSKSVIYSLKWG